MTKQQLLDLLQTVPDTAHILAFDPGELVYVQVTGYQYYASTDEVELRTAED